MEDIKLHQDLLKRVMKVTLDKSSDDNLMINELLAELAELLQPLLGSKAS